MIRAVLFDFDGVVVRSEPLHKQTFLDLLSPYGVSVPEKRWYREFAGTGSRHIFEVLVKEHALSLDVGALVERRKKAYEARVRAGELGEMPGVRDFISLLNGRGIRTAIVSGSHRTNVKAALDTLELGGFFELIVSGDDLHERKPDPGPFLHAAKKLGFPPSECLVIEDSHSGCEAARRAGMKLAWLRPPVEMPNQAADIVISDFSGENLAALVRLLDGD
ncbi:HAD family phosphatase [Candidatus Micrarchaeota archaeon]|nr:HAD family phosphatase [Candidatus Micrarchaeota archaeon]